MMGRRRVYRGMLGLAEKSSPFRTTNSAKERTNRKLARLQQAPLGSYLWKEVASIGTQHLCSRWATLCPGPGRTYMECERGIALVGCGGAGVNFVARSGSKCEDWAKVYAVEADAAHLIMVEVKNSLLMGRKTLRGFGARANPKLAEMGAMESRPDFLRVVQGSKTVFVVVGLGGNTGTAAAVLISRLAKEAGVKVVALGILPFVEEGPAVNLNAQKGLTHLQNTCDVVVVAQNDQLLSLHPKLDLGKALQLMDEALLGEVKRITATGDSIGISGDNVVFLDLGVSHPKDT